MASRKIPVIFITLFLALGGVFLVLDQAQAGPIHFPNEAPFVKAGIYQGVISIVPGGLTCGTGPTIGRPCQNAGQCGGGLCNIPDSVMEIGHAGRFIASNGRIILRPDSGAVPDAQSIQLYATAGQASLSVPGQLCLEGACINLWTDLAAVAPTLDAVLAAGNTSARMIQLTSQGANQEYGCRTAACWTNANGILGFIGSGTRHGSLAFYPTQNAFALVDTSAANPSDDRGALTFAALAFNDLWANNGRFEGNVGVNNATPAARLVVNNNQAGAGSAGDAVAAYANSANSAVYAQQNNFSGWAGYFSGAQGLFATKFHVDYAGEFLAPGSIASGIYSQITPGGGCNTGGQCAAIYGQDSTNSVFANRLDPSGFWWAGYFKGPVGIDNSNRPSSALLVGSNFDGNYALEVHSHNDTNNAANFLGNVRVSQMITTEEVNSGCYQSWVVTTTSAVTNTISEANVNARCDGRNCTIDLSMPQAGGGAITGISSGRYRVDTGGVRQVFVGLESLGGGDGVASPVRRYIATANETILQNSSSVAGQVCTFRWTGTAGAEYELVHPAHASPYFCDLRICD